MQCCFPRRHPDSDLNVVWGVRGSPHLTVLNVVPESGPWRVGPAAEWTGLFGGDSIWIPERNSHK